MIALGRAGGLHADFHAQETPSDRRPIDKTVFAGRLGEPAFPAERRSAA